VARRWARLSRSRAAPGFGAAAAAWPDDEAPAPRRRRPGALPLAWAALILAVAGGAAWLHQGGEALRRAELAALPSVTLPLPPGETPPAPRPSLDQTAGSMPGLGGGSTAATPPADPAAAAPAAPNPAAPNPAAPDPAAPALPAAQPAVAVAPAPPVPVPAPPPAAPDPYGPVPMVPAPASGLTETTPRGVLPAIAPDGREPWRVYGRPFDAADKRPRIALVIAEMGVNRQMTERALAELPGPVTLAFSANAPGLDQWVRRAREDSHEVLLGVPMEPTTFPRDDPGPGALLTTLSDSGNIERLQRAMARSQGYVGIVNHMGSRFTNAPDSLKPVVAELKARGLLLLDNRQGLRSLGGRMATQAGVPRALVDRQLDQVPSRDAIDVQLDELTALARERGVAVAIAAPLPLVVERIKEWLPRLQEAGIALAPVSAAVNLQPDR